MGLDLKETLLQKQTKSLCDSIVMHIGDDPDRFAELMNFFFSGDYRLTQQASRPMSRCVAGHPALIKPYLAKLISNLKSEGQHPAVRRNTLRFLQDIEVPKRYHGALMTACFAFIQAPHEPVAIKAFSITILHNLSKLYPEILPELRLVVAERLGTETAAFRQRAKQLK